MLQRVQPVCFSPWVCLIGLTIAVAITYFLAAQMSLVLLTKPDGVAVFWPAAGISSGTLIAFGSRVRLPVIVGVVTASIAASLLGDRNLAAATVFALCNVGEPLLVAWLIQHHFGEEFRLESLRSVLGFFLAAGIGPAISGKPSDGGVHPLLQPGCAGFDHLAELVCLRCLGHHHGGTSACWTRGPEEPLSREEGAGPWRVDACGSGLREPIPFRFD